MEQYPEEQNNKQSSADAANGTSFDEEAETDIEKYVSSFPCGYRFAPSDEELILNYLMKKVNNQPLPPNLICEVNLYSKDPTQLTEEYKPVTEKEWYFFSQRARKYPNGSRPSRSTPKGYWKPTGIDKAIPHDSQNPVGYKRTLDFYAGDHEEGKRTDWKMHEYILNNNNSQNNDRPKNGMKLDDLVLCKLYKKKEKNGGEGESPGGTTPTTVNVAKDNNEEFLMAENNNIRFDHDDQNRNASQQLVNVSQNNEVSLTAGNNIVRFEDQNWNASQPTVNVLENTKAFFMAGNHMGFENQTWNASQPTVIVPQNNEAFSMARNSNMGFEDQTWNASQPTVNVPHNNEASLMAGNNNIGLEYQTWNASRPTVNASQNNKVSLMAGNNNVWFEDQNWNASQPTLNVPHENEASLKAENNNIGFQNQTWNAFQPTPNQEPMHGEPRTFQSIFMVSRIDDLIMEAYYIWDQIDHAAFHG